MWFRCPERKTQYWIMKVDKGVISTQIVNSILLKWCVHKTHWLLNTRWLLLSNVGQVFDFRLDLFCFLAVCQKDTNLLSLISFWKQKP